jgi:hypothetical protein
LAGIARVVGVSESWLQTCVNKECESAELEVESVKKACRLTVECGEPWPFVGKSDNKQWVLLALDRDAREIVGAGACIGDRSAESAKELWLSLPDHRQLHRFLG